MFFLLSKILAFLIDPFNWCILLLLIAQIIKHRPLRRKFRWTALIVFIVFSNTALFQWIVASWETKYEQPYINPDLEYNIVVLGGYSSIEEATYQISFSAASDRLLHALPLLYKHDNNRLILSGGSAEIYFEETPESEYIKSFLKSIQIDEDRIVIESKSRNTYENAVQVADLFKSVKDTNSVILITSAFHMYRAKSCFNKQNLNVIPYPVDPLRSTSPLKPKDYFFPSLNTLTTWPILIKEWIGIMVYAIKSYI